jgi:hypothetical protein
VLLLVGFDLPASTRGLFVFLLLLSLVRLPPAATCYLRPRSPGSPLGVTHDIMLPSTHGVAIQQAHQAWLFSWGWHVCNRWQGAGVAVRRSVVCVVCLALGLGQLPHVHYIHSPAGKAPQVLARSPSAPSFCCESVLCWWSRV